MPQPPEKPQTNPADVANLVFGAANIYSMMFTPFLRMHEGSRAYALAPFSFVLLVLFANSIPELAPYIPVWVVIVICKRLRPDHSQHSNFRGCQWPLGKVLRDKDARLLELGLMFFGGVFLAATVSEHLGEFVVSGAIAMGIVLGTEMEAIRSQRQRMRDAQAEMEFQARMQRGDDW
jgi:hypothetical protein